MIFESFSGAPKVHSINDALDMARARIRKERLRNVYLTMF